MSLARPQGRQRLNVSLSHSVSMSRCLNVSASLRSQVSGLPLLPPPRQRRAPVRAPTAEQCFANGPRAAQPFGPAKALQRLRPSAHPFFNFLHPPHPPPCAASANLLNYMPIFRHGGSSGCGGKSSRWWREAIPATFYFFNFLPFLRAPPCAMNRVMVNFKPSGRPGIWQRRKPEPPDGGDISPPIFISDSA